MSVALLLPLLVLLAITGTTWAQTITGTTVDGFAYSGSNGQLGITGYSGTATALSVPASISTGTVTWPVTSLAYDAFQFKSKITSVTIPSGVTSIGADVFAFCSALTSVTIPSTVTSIGSQAFWICTSLTSISIPANVTFLGFYPFAGCTVLSSINVDPANQAFCSDSAGVLYDKAQATLIQAPGALSGSYIIPNTVTSIGINAFYSCAALTSLTFGSSVSNISAGAFYSCIGLTSLTFPASLSSIGAFTFQNCTRLLSISIPYGVTSIGDDAFIGCNALANVTLPATVNSIGSAPFENCVNLKSITVNASNATYSSSSDGVLFNKNQTTLFEYPEGKSGSSYVIPGTVTNINTYAFYSCSALSSVTIPAGVTSIGAYAFQFCNNLASVTIPAGVTNIGMETFWGCSRLTTVTIPSAITSIGNGAFSYTGLRSAVFIGNAPTMASGVFNSTAAGFTVYYFNTETGFATPTWDGYPAIDMGTYSPVAPWLLSNGYAYNADLHSTPNNDGVSLLMDYALNLNPTQNQAGNMPQPVISGNQMSLTFYAGTAGVTYTAQFSTDLQNWSTSGVTTSAPDANNFCTATIPVTGTRAFMRLMVTY